MTTGPNLPIDEPDLSQALGDDVLGELTAKTGLSKEEILSRLSRELPKAVDDLTPDGVVPSEDEFNGTTDRSAAPTSVPSVGRIVL
ncbi:YidB family protein [Rhizobium sp. TH2]|uniref:YidB family protein n=1 Tax=Rhizobium sp. TH2 TaxID=2775403 RepID=UPI00280BD948|nr:YidB family protein [Rhizobium sp. TH2]